MAIQTPIDGVTVDCDVPDSPVRPGDEVNVGVNLSNYSNYEIDYVMVLSVDGQFIQRFDSVIRGRGIAIEEATVTLDEPGEYDVNVEVDVERVGEI